MKAEIFKVYGTISVYNGEVVKSDVSVPEELRERLKVAVRSLEDVPEVYKDYHPGSDGKVVDLVHPSLFPLTYGRSRIVEDSLVSLEECIKACGKGNVIPIPSEQEMYLETNMGSLRNDDRVPVFSRKFQWLPCEVEFSDQNDSVR